MQSLTYQKKIYETRLEKDMGNVQGTMVRNPGERTREIDQEINGLESNKDNFEQGNENTTNCILESYKDPKVMKYC